MLSTHQTLPILNHKLFERVVKESKFLSRKNRIEVAVKVSEHIIKVQIGGAFDLSRYHASQHLPERSRPVHQYRGGRSSNLDRGIEISCSKSDLFTAELALFLNRPNKPNQAPECIELQIAQNRWETSSLQLCFTSFLVEARGAIDCRIYRHQIAVRCCRFRLSHVCSAPTFMH